MQRGSRRGGMIQAEGSKIRRQEGCRSFGSCATSLSIPLAPFTSRRRRCHRLRRRLGRGPVTEPVIAVWIEPPEGIQPAVRPSDFYIDGAAVAPKGRKE